MTNNGKSIYKIARESAGITAERAAERLNVELRTLYKYEACAPIPKNDIVGKMAMIYGAPYLCVQHVYSDNSPGVWETIIPGGITEQNVAISALAFLDELVNIQEHRALLVKIARDGLISDDERDDWEHIMEVMTDLMKAGYDLKYSKKETKQNA